MIDGGTERTLPWAIAIDFDGCLCSNHYPEIGAPYWSIIAEAKREQQMGAGLILWTCREGKLLDDALAACERWGLHFDAVNESLPSWKEFYGNDTRKVGADEYWDDKSFRVENDEFSSENRRWGRCEIAEVRAQKIIEKYDGAQWDMAVRLAEEDLKEQLLRYMQESGLIRFVRTTDSCGNVNIRADIKCVRPKDEMLRRC